MMTIARHVRECLNELTPQEKKAAQALLKKYPMTGLETIASFAEQAGVGGATVLRFVRKLGFHAYSDFQRALRDEIGQSQASPLSQYHLHRRDGDADTYLSNFVRDSQANLAELFESIGREEFDELIGLLSDDNRKVFLHGGRFTQFIAAYIAWHLRQIRKRVWTVDGQSETWAGHLVDIDRRSVLVVFDFRRYQNDVIAFAREAAARGATVVLITDSWVSPIASVARSVWCCPIEIPSPYDSALTGLALGECIIGAIIRHKGEPVKKRIESIDALRQQIVGPEKPS